MFQGLVSANFNIYTRLTKGSISSSTLPPSHGYTSYKENFGDLKNEGYDVSVSFRLVNDMKRRINWSMRASFQRNNNILVRLSPAMKKYSVTSKQEMSGISLRHFFTGRRVDGCFVRGKIPRDRSGYGT